MDELWRHYEEQNKPSPGRQMLDGISCMWNLCEVLTHTRIACRGQLVVGLSLAYVD